MKTWKLVSGILSMVMVLMITLQSCAALLHSVLKNNEDDTSGGAGILVALLLLVAGIVSTALWKNKGMGGDVALTILFGFAALLGFANQGIFKDLVLWSSWALFCAIMAVVSLILKCINLEK